MPVRVTVVLACASCVLLCGCATQSTSTAGTTTQVRRPHPRHRHEATHHAPTHRARRPPRRRIHGTGLAASTAAAGRIQPQPAPGSCHVRGSGRFSLPDRRCTPGAIDPHVTQANIHDTICRVGYSESVRPPESVTEPEKLDSMAAYGDTGSPRGYEYDHLVSLELGGARNDPRNLWPEPGASPNPKDSLEDRLHAMVCSGALSLASAQRQIATNWIAAYRRLIG